MSQILIVETITAISSVYGKRLTKRKIMLLYKGNSGWTSAGRNHAVHVAGPDRRPLCGKSYKNGSLEIWDGEENEVTCDKCKKIVAKKK